MQRCKRRGSRETAALAVVAPRRSLAWRAVASSGAGLPPETEALALDIGRMIETARGQVVGADDEADVRLRAHGLTESLTRKIRPALAALSGAVVLVLLIACANVSHLLLVDAAARRRELALRATLGAGRTRLLRQLLTESLVLALLGAGLGTGLAVVALHALRGVLPERLLAPEAVVVDLRGLAFAIVCALVAAFFFGAWPAISGSRHDLIQALKSSGEGYLSRRRFRISGLLMASEVALATILLVGAGLLVTTFLNLTRHRLGFEPDRRLVAELELPAARYPDRERQWAFSDQLLERLRALPGVEGAAISTSLPVLGGSFIALVGKPGAATEAAEPPTATCTGASSRFLETLGARAIEGRGFTPEDLRGGDRLAVVNQSLARTLWSEPPFLGRQITIQGQAHDVVGVFADMRQEVDAETFEPTVYVPFRQFPLPWPYLQLVVKTSAEPAPLISAVRQAVWEVDATLPLESLTTYREVLSDSAARERFAMTLVLLFALLALVLSLVGVHSVSAATALRRRHEIGVRMALGARRAQVVALLLREGTGFVVAGLVVGLGGAVALSEALASFLYGVVPGDRTVLLQASLALLVPAGGAIYLSARQAAAADPAVTLRSE